MEWDHLELSYSKTGQSKPWYILYVCMYVCMCIRTYVCMYVCRVVMCTKGCMCVFSIFYGTATNGWRQRGGASRCVEV